MAPSLGRFQNVDMSSKSAPIEVIEVPDDDPDDFPDSGPQNPVEAQSYRDKIDGIMEKFSDLLADDCKDTLRSTVMSLKKLMVKNWQQMAEADIEVVMKSIHDPSCVYLCQHLTTEGVDVMEPATEIPEGWTSIRQLPKKVQKDRGLGIVMCFNHLSEAHAHMSLFAANMSSLAKICDPETFDMVMKAAARTDDSDQHPGVLSESSARSPPKMTAEEIVTVGEGPASPSSISCTGTTVWTHPTSRCSHLAVPQVQILQWRHSQGSLHHI